MGSLVFRIAGSGGGGGTCADGSWVTGKVGSYALQFGGEDSDDRVIIPVAASTGSSNGLSGTLSAWIYPTANSNYETIFMHGRNTMSYGANYVNFGLHTDGTLRYRFGLNNAINTWYSSDTVPLNQWSHVALTSKGTPVKFYINGTQSATSGRTDMSWWINNLGGSSHDVSTIGCAMLGGPYPLSWTCVPWWEFEGKIDEFGIWTEALNLGGVKALYNGGDGAACSTVSSSYLNAYYNMEEGAGNGTLTDRTGNGYTGTLTSMDTGSC